MRAQFIYEKFEEESDPIQDMGIGNSFNHLRVGTILKANTDIRITSSTSFSGKGRLIAWADQYMIVIKSERTQLDKNRIKVWYVNKGSGLDNAKLTVKNISNYITGTGSYDSMTGTAQQYEKRFAIIG